MSRTLPNCRTFPNAASLRRAGPPCAAALLLLVGPPGAGGAAAQEIAGQEAVALDQLSVEGEGGLSLTRAAPVGLNLRTPDRAASRLGLTPLETPASVDVISGETVQLRGQNTVAEAVTQDATGITSIASPGNGNGAFTSRGFAGPNSIQQLYDGTRFYVGANTVTFPFDTWNVERIEVLRGPSSVLYGDGAIGGVINVVPKKPTFASINAARVAVGTYGTARAAFDSGGAIGREEFGETFAYRLNVSGNRSDGWVTPVGDFRNLAVSGALLFRPSPDLAFTLSHDLGYQEPARYWGTPLVEGRIPDLIRFRNYNVLDPKITWNDNWTQFRTEWAPTADLTVRNTAYRLTSRRHWEDVEQYAFNRTTGLVDRSDYLEIYHSQQQIGNRFDAALRGDLLGLPNAFLAGFDVNHIDFRHTNNFTFDKSDSVPLVGGYLGLFPQDGRATPGYATATNQASVFAEDRLVLSERLSFLTGFRFDVPTLNRIDLRSGSEFERTYKSLGYRFGLVYNPTADSALYAQYSFATDPVNSLITLNQSLAGFKLATGDQVEIGAKGVAFEGALEWTIAGYRIVKDNLISAIPGNLTLATQVGSQSSQGFELALGWLFAPRWRLDGNLAVLHAQYDRFDQTVNGATVSYAGFQPIDVPERVVNLWLTHEFDRDWTARIGLRNVGQVYTDFGNQFRRPAFNLVNVVLDRRVTDDSRLSLRVYNLFDKVYALSGNVVNGTGPNWLLAPPRTVELAYTVAW